MFLLNLSLEIFMESEIVVFLEWQVNFLLFNAIIIHHFLKKKKIVITCFLFSLVLLRICMVRNMFFTGFFYCVSIKMVVISFQYMLRSHK